MTEQSPTPETLIPPQETPRILQEIAAAGDAIGLSDRARTTRIEENLDAPVVQVDCQQTVTDLGEETAARVRESLVVVQPTRGCRGGCPGCLFGRKDGVTHAFEERSIVSFLRSCGKKVVGLFQNSDPLDHPGYVNIQSSLDNAPGIVMTSVPPGSEERLSALVEHAFNNRGTNKDLKVSLSIWRHNFGRVERAINDAYRDLLVAGYDVAEVNTFVDSHILYTLRFDIESGALEGVRSKIKDALGELATMPVFQGLLNLGEKVDRLDSFRHPVGPMAMDGTVLRPGEDPVVSVVAMPPSEFDPSGLREIPITSGGPVLARYVPDEVQYRNVYGETCSHSDEISFLASVMPPLRTVEGAEYITDDPVETATLHVARAGVRMHQVMERVVASWNSGLTALLLMKGLPEDLARILEQQDATPIDEYAEYLRNCLDTDMPEARQQEIAFALRLFDFKRALLSNLCEVVTSGNINNPQPNREWFANTIQRAYTFLGWGEADVDDANQRLADLS